jgi:hypothetical protein
LLSVNLEDIVGWLPCGEDTTRDEVSLLCLLEQLDNPDVAVTGECQPDGTALWKFFKKVLEKPEKLVVRPIDVESLVGTLSEAIAPVVPAWVPYQRVIGGIQGLVGDPLAPQEICFGLNLPLWRDLRDLAPDWLLPGVGQIKEDSIVALEANPKFIDALLVGVNSQLVNELRWRNIPIATGCTPVKMFWDQVDLGEDVPQEDCECGTEAPPPGHKHDIKGIITWVGNTPANILGGATHRPDANDVGRRLVVVFRSNLFRRYPQTVVSLVSAVIDPTSNRADWEQNPASDAAQLLPVIQGAIGEDIVFFGFDVEASEADR